MRVFSPRGCGIREKEGFNLRLASAVRERLASPNWVQNLSLCVQPVLPAAFPSESLQLAIRHHIRHASVWTTLRFGLFGFGFWSTPNALPTQSKTSFAAGLMSSQSNAMAVWMPIPYGRRMMVSTPGI